MPSANVDVVPDFVLETYKGSPIGFSVTGLDLTGYGMSFHLRSGTRSDPGAIVLAISTANSRISCSSAGFTVSVAGTVMFDVPAAEYYAEVLGFPGGDVTSDEGLFLGWAVVNHHATRIGLS